VDLKTEYSIGDKRIAYCFKQANSLLEWRKIQKQKLSMFRFWSRKRNLSLFYEKI